MTINQETVSLALYITGLMIAQFAAISRKISRIELRSEHFVTFEHCSNTREKCPCVNDCSSLRGQVDSIRDRLIVLELKQ